MLDNKNLFLSKKVIYSFGGFANKLIEKADANWSAYLYTYKVSEVSSNISPYVTGGWEKFNKIVMNAVRIYLMLFDILEKG